MTKAYKLCSRAYRVLLGLFVGVFLLLSSLFSDFNDSNDTSGMWFVLFCVLTVIILSIFHRLADDNRYKIVVQIIACLLVLTSLGFLLFLFFSGEDGNLLIKSVFLITIVINTGLLFYLVQDQKYNHNN